MKRKMVGLIMFVPMMVLSLACSRAQAQEWPVSGFYQIISGDYGASVELCCFIFTLPDPSQSYVELVVDEQRTTVQMAILGADRRTGFDNFGSNGCTFLTNGVVLADHIQFAWESPVLFGASWIYTISNSAGGLRIDGGFSEGIIEFWHANVVAVLVAAVPIPMLSLPRASSSGTIEFTVFNGRPGQTNVIEASTDLLRWTAISTNVFPSTDCPFIDFQDTASTNLARRYFRAFSLP